MPGCESLPATRSRGRRYESRRYFHERTGEAMPAYVVGAYVVEKARRDWDARPYRGAAGNPDRREWWEVRRQGTKLRPGVSLGRLLYSADTLRECLQWIAEALAMRTKQREASWR